MLICLPRGSCSHFCGITTSPVAGASATAVMAPPLSWLPGLVFHSATPNFATDCMSCNVSLTLNEGSIQIYVFSLIVFMGV